MTATLSLIFAFSGCSGESYPTTATGGAGMSPAGATSTGGSATGGTTAASGGNSTGGTATGGLATGGAPSSGGTSFGTGGTSFGTGGATGGTSAITGGSFPGGSGGSAAGAGHSGGAAGGSVGGQSGGAGQGGSSPGGSTATGGAAAVSFLEVENIIGNNCVGCHVNRRPIFTTTGTALYNTLISTAVTQCGNHKLVVPNDPTNSAVIQLVTNKCNGFKMPTSCSDPVCLVPDELTKLTNWISAGAKSP